MQHKFISTLGYYMTAVDVAEQMSLSHWRKSLTRRFLSISQRYCLELAAIIGLLFFMACAVFEITGSFTVASVKWALAMLGITFFISSALAAMGRKNSLSIAAVTGLALALSTSTVFV